MERDLALALRDAVDVARSRGQALVRVVLHGDAVVERARDALRELGAAGVEVVVVGDAGPVRLGAVELGPRAEGLTAPSGTARPPRRLS